MREKEFLPLVKERFGIDEINPMQKKMLEVSTQGSDIILLSPTGSGKTLAFLFAMLKYLKPASGRLQAVIIAPSRELVLQIAKVTRQLASGYKVTELYGGHKVEDEVNSLSVVPDIVVATPGRLLDHARRRNIDLLPTRILVLDEFDKTLELGFEEEMEKIVKRLKNVSKTILTSATRADVLPEFLKLDNPLTLDYLEENRQLRWRLAMHRVDSDGKDKLETLYRLLLSLADADGVIEKTIVFVNHRESAERVAEFLRKRNVPVILYHGALDQHKREMALAAFNNGSRPVLVATDLAARGIDIEKVRSVIHYHQALSKEAHTHRNGRTARVENNGDVFILVGPDEDVKEYVETDDVYFPDYDGKTISGGDCHTLCFGEGKKEKISKGDILGFLVKEVGVPPEDVLKIDVFDHYALAGVLTDNPRRLAERAAKAKIKKRRVTVTLVE